jgi:hypothetical protein
VYSQQEDASKEVLERQLAEQQLMVRRLYGIIVRSMVVLKYAVRAFALAACWLWIGKKETYYLAGFILVVAVFQLAIDKARQTINPKVKLSEWNIS